MTNPVFHVTFALKASCQVSTKVLKMITPTIVQAAYTAMYEGRPAEPVTVHVDVHRLSNARGMGVTKAFAFISCNDDGYISSHDALERSMVARQLFHDALDHLQVNVTFSTQLTSSTTNPLDGWLLDDDEVDRLGELLHRDVQFAEEVEDKGWDVAFDALADSEKLDIVERWLNRGGFRPDVHLLLRDQKPNFSGMTWYDSLTDEQKADAIAGLTGLPRPRALASATAAHQALGRAGLTLVRDDVPYPTTDSR